MSLFLDLRSTPPADSYPNLDVYKRQHKEIARIRDLPFREGMKPLRISGAMKVAAGVTTLAEVFKVAPPIEHN